MADEWRDITGKKIKAVKYEEGRGWQDCDQLTLWLSDGTRLVIGSMSVAREHSGSSEAPKKCPRMLLPKLCAPCVFVVSSVMPTLRGTLVLAAECDHKLAQEIVAAMNLLPR